MKIKVTVQPPHFMYQVKLINKQTLCSFPEFIWHRGVRAAVKNDMEGWTAAN